jgi:hypothetical protein
MIDDVLRFGMKFDWITPLWALYQDWRNRPSTGFAVPIDGGWPGLTVQNLLRSKGVQTWGMMFIDDDIIFRLRVAQAEHARYWMDREGVPYYGAITRIRPPRRKRRQRRCRT